MIGALLGKALGFVREIQLAKHLGANLVADSLRGAMVAVLMPIAPLQGAAAVRVEVDAVALQPVGAGSGALRRVVPRGGDRPWVR